MSADQVNAVDRLYEHDNTLLVANMGAGKTAVTLTAASELLEAGVVKRVLVIAPVKVCNSVWPEECAKWGHLTGIKVANAAGSNEKKRRAALDGDAPIVCINFENIAWLFRVYKAKGKFDGLIVDELSRFKSGGGTGFKALRPRLNDFKWRVGMTGTPVSEDWEGLYGQMLVVDSGARLGTRKDLFKRKYFYPTDYNEYNWEMLDWAPAEISKKIEDVVYTMPDYRHELPPLEIEQVVLPMPPALRKTYEEMKGSMVVSFEGEGVEAESAAVLSNKLLQCANGFLYGPEDCDGVKPTHWLDRYKIDACAGIASSWRKEGEQVIICYWFGADLKRLEEIFGSDCKVTPETVDKWNSGEQGVLLLHPRSAGHGLNLAAGGRRMLWLGPVWSRDLREQTVARLWRRGQTQPVQVVDILAENSIDQLVVDRVESKEEYERMFKQYLGS